MELVFSRKEMDKAMGMVSRVAGKAAILPVLSHVLISTQSDMLWNIGDAGDGHDGIYLAATDLEVGTRTKIFGRVIEGGAVALPARTFASVVNALAEEEH